LFDFYGDTFSFTKLEEAIVKNGIYKNARWFFIDKNLLSHMTQQLPETDYNCIIKDDADNMIVFLNEERNKILNIFYDQVSALRFTNLPITSSLIKKAISKNQKLLKKYYVTK